MAREAKVADKTQKVTDSEADVTDKTQKVMDSLAKIARIKFLIK